MTRFARIVLLSFAVSFVIALGMGLYAAGRATAMRECPPAQHGERLLSSEQHPNETVCIYASGSAGYGLRIQERKILEVSVD